MIKPEDGHLVGFDFEVADGVSSGFVIAEEVSAAGIGACDYFDGFFDSTQFRVK